MIAWLAGWDDPTCRTITSLMWRCRLAGAAAAPGSRMAAAGRDERDHATAVGEPGDCDDLIEDDDTSTCSTCGALIGMFTGRAGWQHYRGRPLEIYDAGHEATLAPGQDGPAGEPAGEAGPGTVELRLSGSPEDTGTLISVLERLAGRLACHYGRAGDPAPDRPPGEPPRSRGVRLRARPGPPGRRRIVNGDRLIRAATAPWSPPLPRLRDGLQLFPRLRPGPYPRPVGRCRPAAAAIGGRAAARPDPCNQQAVRHRRC